MQESLSTISLLDFGTNATTTAEQSATTVPSTDQSLGIGDGGVSPAVIGVVVVIVLLSMAVIYLRYRISQKAYKYMWSSMRHIQTEEDYRMEIRTQRTDTSTDEGDDRCVLVNNDDSSE